MRSKWFGVLNIFILTIVCIILLFFVWNYSFEDTSSDKGDCVDVNNVASFVYDTCYNAYDKKIYMRVSRSYDSYVIRSIKISFFDLSDKFFEMVDIPKVDGEKIYEIHAEKNPEVIEIRYDVVRDFSAPLCDRPRRIPIKYCPVASSIEGGINLGDKKINNSFDRVSIGGSEKSDRFSMDLVDKERIWESACKSVWDCSPWGECDGKFQRRKCVDISNCPVPIDSPETVRYCDGTCVENWECSWSSCEGGYSTPTCKDLNNCGTEFNLPQKMPCGGLDSGSCVPEVVCEPWSRCEVDYTFLDLVEGELSEMDGEQSRICRDINGCVMASEEKRDCSVNVDVYTSRFEKCGIEYIGIYNRLDGNLLARIEEGTSDNPYLNIYLDENADSPYCDYCFDGVLNGDEEMVDCGGSCQSCDDKYVRIDSDYSGMGFWGFIGNLLN